MADVCADEVVIWAPLPPWGTLEEESVRREGDEFVWRHVES